MEFYLQCINNGRHYNTENMSVTLNFNKICRLCMVENAQLLPLFVQDDNLVERLMTVLPVLKVGICR